MKFRFHPDALQEYENSTFYYLDISPQLAKSFIGDIEKSIKRIQRTPLAWAIHGTSSCGADLPGAPALYAVSVLFDFAQDIFYCPFLSFRIYSNYEIRVG